LTHTRTYDEPQNYTGSYSITRDATSSKSCRIRVHTFARTLLNSFGERPLSNRRTGSVDTALSSRVALS